MKKFMSILLILTLVIGMSLGMTACGNDDGGDSNSSGEPELTVGFIYIGSKNDGGYTQAQHKGTAAMEKHFGNRVKVLTEENTPEDQQSVISAAERMIDNGATVIFGCSYGFVFGLEEMANNSEYADIKFLHFSGDKMNDTNFGNYFGATEEPRYLSGIAAGMATENNKLGYVAAKPLPEVKIGINAFTLGAQSVNENVEVNVVYTGEWDDPAKETEAAESLLDQGCDVITQHADSAGPQHAAAKAGKYSIGYNIDNSGLEGLEDSYLTAPIWHHEVFLIPTIEKIMDGTWTPESYYGTMKDGYVDIAPLTKNVSDEAKAEIEEVQKQMKDGNFNVFTGPIIDSNDKEQAKEGEVLDRNNIWGIDGGKLMDYVVKGVNATE